MVLAAAAACAAAAAAGAGAYWLAHPKKRVSAGDLKLHRAGEGVYCYRGFFSNSAVFVTGGAVVVVDTQVAPKAASRLLREIRAVTDKPIEYVVNTHYHGDHSGGNALFPEAEVVATADTAKYVVERDSERVEYAETFGLELESVHPTIGPHKTFSGRIELDAGGEKIEVLQLGQVETPDACVVWWPAKKAIAAGDGVATFDYPFLGVPFLGEGLRGDGQWIGYLEKIRALEPEILIPGHGPILIGREVIRDRLNLLISLFRDLLQAVQAELDAGTPRRELVERVDQKLAHYRRRDDLAEYTVSQRFAIYRCLNNLSPDRAGKGWWHDLRPSVVRRAGEAEVTGAKRRGLTYETALKKGDGPLAHALLDQHLAKNPTDAEAWGRLADYTFDAAKNVRPMVDATEYIALSGAAAKKALALDPNQRLGLLNLGAARVFGGLVLAQPMDHGIALLERALKAGLEQRSQRLKAYFFLGRAHQAEERDAEADEYYRQLLPAPLGPFYPLVRERIRQLL